MATIYRLMAFKSFLIYDAPNLYPEGWLSPGFKAIKCLRIMTYHQSKGLEYPVVFMPFLTKHSIFPQKNPGGTNAWGIFNDDTIKQQYADDTERTRAKAVIFQSYQSSLQEILTEEQHDELIRVREERINQHLTNN